MSTRTRTHKHKCMHKHTHTLTHACTITQTHTRTLTHIQTLRVCVCHLADPDVWRPCSHLPLLDDIHARAEHQTPCVHTEAAGGAGMELRWEAAFHKSIASLVLCTKCVLFLCAWFLCFPLHGMRYFLESIASVVLCTECVTSLRA